MYLFLTKSLHRAYDSGEKISIESMAHEESLQPQTTTISNQPEGTEPTF